MSYSLFAVNKDLDTAPITLTHGETRVVMGGFESLHFHFANFTRRKEPRFIVSHSTIAGMSHCSSTHSDLADRVRRTVTGVLADGVPTLSAVASKLGIGTRTLQRHLSAGGHSFQSIVDLARKNLAQKLLRETDYSLAEVAFLTGFSEQSGFTRAFKRWAGQTPRSYRLEVNLERQSHFDMSFQGTRPPKRESSLQFSYQLIQ